MLKTAAVKVSLREPRGKFLDMIEFLKYFGTQSIHLVHVLGSSARSEQEKAEKAMAELAAGAEERGVEAHTHLERGHVASRIVEVAEELSVDYICIYWMAKHLLKQAIFGSIDSDIMRMSDVPILVHNRKVLGAAPSELESVLYPTNFKYTDHEALRYLTDMDFKAQKLVILHVGERAPDPYAEQERKGRVLKSLDRLAEECRDAYHEIETVDVIGRPRKQVLRLASVYETDLIVIGKSDNPDAIENLVGSTAESVARKSRCSVFIVPSRPA